MHRKQTYLTKANTEISIKRRRPGPPRSLSPRCQSLLTFWVWETLETALNICLPLNDFPSSFWYKIILKGFEFVMAPPASFSECESASEWAKSLIHQFAAAKCFYCVQQFYGYDTGLGLSSVVIDLLFDFNFCRHYQNCCKSLVIYTTANMCANQLWQSWIPSSQPCRVPQFVGFSMGKLPNNHN